MTSATLSLHWLEDVLDLVKLDLTQFFRNKLIVISTLLTSVSMVLAFGFGTTEMPGMGDHAGSYFQFIFPGIVGVGIMFSCTYTIGYAFIVDCQRRTMEDIVLSPLSYVGFLTGRLLGMVVKCSLQFLLVMILAMSCFGAEVSSLSGLLFAFFTEALTFAGLGILVATFTNEISFAGLINLFIIPLTYFCGVFFPLDSFGEQAYLFAALPLSVHIDVFREAITGQASTHFVSSQWLSAAYALLMILVAMYAFKRRIQKG